MWYSTSVLALLLVLVGGCPRDGYRSWFSNVTQYKYSVGKAKKTPAGVRYFAPAKDDTQAFRDKLDVLTHELAACLPKANPSWQVRRDWFVVLVPTDWYVSACSKQQLVPSTPPCSACRSKKLVIPDKCCGLRLPTSECKCVCNMRAVVQDNYAIVTAPNLLLYKAELARLITNVNNVWTHKQIRQCL